MKLIAKDLIIVTQIKYCKVKQFNQVMPTAGAHQIKHVRWNMDLG